MLALFDDFTFKWPTYEFTWMMRSPRRKDMTTGVSLPQHGFTDPYCLQNVGNYGYCVSPNCRVDGSSLTEPCKIDIYMHIPVSFLHLATIALKGLVWHLKEGGLGGWGVMAKFLLLKWSIHVPFDDALGSSCPLHLTKAKAKFVWTFHFLCHYQFWIDCPLNGIYLYLSRLELVMLLSNHKLNNYI